MIEIKENAGYVINDVVNVGEKVFVIGFNSEAVEQYVTWVGAKLHDEYTFYWGHYFTSRIEAENDLWKRVGKQLEHDKREIPWKIKE